MRSTRIASISSIGALDGLRAAAWSSVLIGIAAGCDPGSSGDDPCSGAAGCTVLDEEAPRFDGATAAIPLPSAIRLEWEPAWDDLGPPEDIVYAVYPAIRSGAQDLGQPARVTVPGATVVIMGGLPSATTFFYVVRARDAAGNEDDNTREVSSTTPEIGDETPPVFAGVETATPVGSSSMHLAWQPASDEVTPAADIVYRVYVAEAPGAQDFAAPRLTTPAGARDVLVSGLAAGTTYAFTVRAVDAAGNEDGNTVESSAATGSAIRFSSQVQPILTESCTSAGCHAGRMPAESLDLTAGTAYGALVGVASVQCAGRLLVAPGEPQASYLVHKLIGMDMCSGTQMPKGLPLTQAEIQIIIDWIALGAGDD